MFVNYMELLPSFHFSTAFRNRFKTGEPGSRGSDAVSKAETVRAKMNSVPSGRHGIQPAKLWGFFTGFFGRYGSS